MQINYTEEITTQLWQAAVLINQTFAEVNKSNQEKMKFLVYCKTVRLLIRNLTEFLILTGV